MEIRNPNGFSRPHETTEFIIRRNRCREWNQDFRNFTNDMIEYNKIHDNKNIIMECRHNTMITEDQITICALFREWRYY